MTVFPKTDFYLINYFPGSSGTFLQTLMALIYYDAAHNTFTEYGNAINTVNPRFYNERYEYNPIDDKPIYKNVLNCIPIDSNKPVFTRSHEVPDIENLYTKYPKCKHIVIQLDYVGRIMSYTQDFIKNFREMYRMGDINGTASKWNHFSAKYFNNAKTPKDVTDIQLKEYAETVAKYECMYPYDSSFDLSQTEMISIPLTDIHFKSQKVLDLLASILNKKIPKNAEIYYQQYLNKQHKLYEILRL